jgi:hypothetical protein
MSRGRTATRARGELEVKEGAAQASLPTAIWQPSPTSLQHPDGPMSESLIGRQQHSGGRQRVALANGGLPRASPGSCNQARESGNLLENDGRDVMGPSRPPFHCFCFCFSILRLPPLSDDSDRAPLLQAPR